MFVCVCVCWRGLGSGYGTSSSSSISSSSSAASSIFCICFYRTCTQCPSVKSNLMKSSHTGAHFNLSVTDFLLEVGTENVLASYGVDTLLVFIQYDHIRVKLLQNSEHVHTTDITKQAIIHSPSSPP